MMESIASCGVELTKTCAHNRDRIYIYITHSVMQSCFGTVEATLALKIS